ncbi:SprT-like family-domain-containing protein [Trametes polyzona]|nr:SprT-like family-domain-containing protein [Trametes polyzona]
MPDSQSNSAQPQTPAGQGSPPKSRVERSPQKPKGTLGRAVLQRTFAVVLGPNGEIRQPEPGVVSDSEEERQRRVYARGRAVLAKVNLNELPVIEISDSEDEDEDASDTSVVARKGVSQPLVLPGKEAASNRESENGTAAHPTPKPPRASALRTGSSVKHIVIGSDDEFDAWAGPRSGAGGPAPTPETPLPRRRRLPLDDDIIDLTVSSPEVEPPRPRPEPALSNDKAKGPDHTDHDEQRGSKTKGKASRTMSRTSYAPGDDPQIPLYLDDDSEDEDVSGPPAEDPFAFDDGSILILNEPRSARKPRRRLEREKEASPATPVRTTRIVELLLEEVPLEEDALDPIKPKARPKSKSKAGLASAVPSPGPSRSTPRGGKDKEPRLTKKQQREAELASRRAYATAFFKELNDAVFGGGIPETTELIWSKRLLTTAGRAHWRKDRYGRNFTSIQLAEKVLDCKERIRNTLSHEMCHLAAWIISDAPDEQHGSIFKGWARKVMKKRKDVEVTTRHDYEIEYKYQWKCEDCPKIYGRHSKSIDPDEHACGACGGRLIPQFQTRARAPRTPKPQAGSQNAAARIRDSPLVMPGAFPASPAVQGKRNAAVPREATRSALVDEEDSEIQILAHTLSEVQLVANQA